MKKDSNHAPAICQPTAEARDEYKAAAQGSASLIQTARDLREHARHTRERSRELRSVSESRRMRILMTSWEAEALRALSLELEPAGFTVTYTRELSTFLELLQSHDFGCAVIGDSIPAYLRLELLRDAKQSKPNVPLVVIEGREEEVSELKPFAAKILKPSEPVAHVLRAIRSVTRKSKPQLGACSATP